MMDDNVVAFPGITRLDGDPAITLAEAVKEGLAHVVVIGETEDGEEYFASSVAGGPDVLWMLARAQKRLLEVVDAGE